MTGKITFGSRIGEAPIILSRRSLLAAGAAIAARGALLARGDLTGCKIGVTDWNLKLTGKIEAVALAKSLGFAGVQVSLGRNPIDGRLPLDDGGVQGVYLQAAKQQKIALAGTCLDILHVNFLKKDQLGPKWVAAGIPITRQLNAKVMLLPFFGNGALTTVTEKNYVADIQKELAPEAVRANVLLGLENTISAEDNVRIMERAQSSAVRVYYDVGNSTKNGFDVVKEIGWLGRDRICQIHLKDKIYIGDGPIDFLAVMKSIAAIKYQGFANLETSSPSGSVEVDMRRNLEAVRKFMEEAKAA
jgi:L-ribulose-5-phosphate 3-epimerase